MPTSKKKTTNRTRKIRTSDGTVVFIRDLAPGETMFPEKLAKANEILNKVKFDPKLFR